MGEHVASVLLAVGEQERPDRLGPFLRAAGMEVHLASPGAAVDLARLDVAVVELSALAAGAPWACEARRRHPDLEVVAVAPPDALPSALRALRQGASDLLASPLEPAALLDAVARAAERRLARAAAREAAEEARWAELGRLAGGLAHEIANPVTVILSALTAVADGLGAPGRAGSAERAQPVSGDEVEEAVEEAVAGAQRLRTLSQDLRAVLRADPGALAPVEVAEAVQAALRIGRPEIVAHAQVVLDIPPGLCAFASQGALIEALLHVLVRGARAIAAAGRRRAPLRVRAERRGAAVAIEVEDDVPPAEADPALPHLAGRVPAGMAAGPGARGLAVARDLVERQGGACTARVSPGGTVIAIALRASPLG